MLDGFRVQSLFQPGYRQTDWDSPTSRSQGVHRSRTQLLALPKDTTAWPLPVSRIPAPAPYFSHPIPAHPPRLPHPSALALPHTLSSARGSRRAQERGVSQSVVSRNTRVGSRAIHTADGGFRARVGTWVVVVGFFAAAEVRRVEVVAGGAGRQLGTTAHANVCAVVSRDHVFEHHWGGFPCAWGQPEQSHGACTLACRRET